MNTYKLTAHIINPFDKEQKRLLGDNYKEVVKDYRYIQKSNILDKRVKRMLKYPIESNVWKYTTDNVYLGEYIIEEDADGLYLYEKWNIS